MTDSDASLVTWQGVRGCRIVRDCYSARRGAISRKREAAGVGFEPTAPSGATVFKTAPFDRSGTPPPGKCGRTARRRVRLPPGRRQQVQDPETAIFFGTSVPLTDMVAVPVNEPFFRLLLTTTLFTSGERFLPGTTMPTA
jgi:hypothetical protein